MPLTKIFILPGIKQNIPSILPLSRHDRTEQWKRAGFIMSKLIKAIAAALVLAIFISLCGFSNECAQIRQKVLRLHVLANSDSEADQQLKLKVRDTVVETAAGLFDNASDADEALQQAEVFYHAAV